VWLSPYVLYVCMYVCICIYTLCLCACIMACADFETRLLQRGDRARHRQKNVGSAAGPRCVIRGESRPSSPFHATPPPSPRGPPRRPIRAGHPRPIPAFFTVYGSTLAAGEGGEVRLVVVGRQGGG
jgi:hypothetical protein